MHYPVRRITTPLTIASSGTTITSSAFQINGILRGICVNAPALTSSNTYTVSIIDDNGYTVFSKASLTANAKTSIFVDTNNNYLQFPVSGRAYTITVTSSGTEGSARVFSVDLLTQGT